PPATTVAAAASSAAPVATTTAGPESAGSVALAQGSVTDTATDGTNRQLKDGDTVYPGDAFALGNDSYLDLDLEDGGRILLRPDTSFQIQEYHFDPDAHPAAGAAPLLATSQQKPESAFFKLVKGGLRAVDGLIGQTTPKDYAVETPVATIGVRGTAFDVRYCGDDCADEADTTGAPQNGLYTAVSDGSIGVKNDGGETVTKAGEYSYVKDKKSVVQRRTTPPRALRHMALPAKFKARAEKNRAQIQTNRQQHRQQVLEQRRRQATEKAKPPVKTEQGKAAGGKDERQTPAERRQQRMQQRREQNEAKRERRKQENAQGVGKGREAQTQKPEERTPASRGEQRRERLNERRQERQAGKPEATQAAGPAEHEQKRDDAKAGCKDKKKKRKDKDKDKDKCGGD
ncbi:MAG: FecR domain-containing protein, partial [Gammaproteobacteria bacterium]